MRLNVRTKTRWTYLLCWTWLCTTLGCGGSAEKFPLSQLRGTVTVEGKPVGNGTIIMNPVAQAGATGNPGKGASSTIGPDGSFTMTTYQDGDGVIIGEVEITAAADDPAQQWPANLKAPVNYTIDPAVHSIELDIQKDGTGKITPGS